MGGETSKMPPTRREQHNELPKSMLSPRSSKRKSEALPLTIDQLNGVLLTSVELATEYRVGHVFIRIEKLLQELTQATSVRMNLVSIWHQRLLYYKVDANTLGDGGELLVVQIAATDRESAIGMRVAESGQVMYRKHGDHGDSVLWPLLPLEAGNVSMVSPALAVVELVHADGPFSQHAKDLLGHAMFLIGGWVHRAVMGADDMLRFRMSQSILCINEIASLNMDLEDLCAEIINTAYYATEADRIALYFVDELEKELWVVKSNGLNGATIPLGVGLAGHAALTGEILNVSDCYEDPRFDPVWDTTTGYLTRSVLCMPIPPPDRYVMEERMRQKAGTTGTVDAPLPTDETAQKSAEKSSTSTSSSTPAGEEGMKRTNSLLTIEAMRKWGPGGRKMATPDHGRNNSTSNMKGGGKGPGRRAPLAVLQVLNKRGSEAFEQADEEQLHFLCLKLESLLVSRTVEVTLLKRANMEKKRLRQGKPDGRTYAHARLQTAILGSFNNLGTQQRRYRSSRAERPATNPELSMETQLEGEEQDDTDNDGDSPQTSRTMMDRCASIMFKDEPDSDMINWEFNCFEADTVTKCAMLESMFVSLGAIQILGCTAPTLRNFIEAVRCNYNQNPFHNFNHAFSVAHVAYMMIQTITDMHRHLTPIDMLSVLIASLCHDLDHPGNNNTFEINTMSPLAILHADGSVLERHHAHVTFRILFEAGGANDILANLSREKKMQTRNFIVRNILATDMAQHMDHCQRATKLMYRAKQLRQAQQGGTPVHDRHRSHFPGLVPLYRISGSSRQSSEALAPSPTAAGGASPTSRNVLERENSQTFLNAAAAAAGKLSDRPPPPPPIDVNRADVKEDEKATEEPPMKSKSPIQSVSSPADDGGAGLPLVGDSLSERASLAELMVHCCDLSGQVMTTHLALEWGRRILQEFRNQADAEQRLNIPITVVNVTTEEEILKGQIFFLTNIVAPLWEPFAATFPGLDHLAENLAANHAYYEKMLKECQSREVPPPAPG